LFKDRSALSAEHSLHYYGGFFETVAVLWTRLLPFGPYESRHLLNALFGVIGLFGCWKLVRFLTNSSAAFWTVLLLALYPSYYGHMFINSKDIPFAVLHVWSLYYLLRFLAQSGAVSFGLAATTGLVIGLCMAVRVGGLLLLAYLYLFAGAHLAYLWKIRKELPLPIAQVGKRVLAALCVTTVIAYVVMLVFWPYGMSKPLVRPFSTLRLFSSYQVTSYPMDYIPRYLAIKLPEIATFLIVIALWLGIRKLLHTKPWEAFPKTLSYLLLAFSVVFPVAYVIIQKAATYDEIRHFLFIIPPLFCIAGITFDIVFSWVLKRTWTMAIVLPLLSIYAAYHVGLMVQLHPYEYIYYNRFIGGVTGAYQRGYETDYWVTGYREGVKAMEAYLRNERGEAFEQTQYRVLVEAAPWCATYYFPKNFVPAASASDAHIYLSTTRDGLDRRYGGREVVAVRRSGVPLVIAKVLD
jgi:hypothetical protein